jgi:hypothetical protein
MMIFGWKVLVKCWQQYPDTQQCTEKSKQKTLSGVGLAVTHRKSGHGDPVDDGGEENVD